MHMSDALISPLVGGGMWVVSTGIIAYCSRRLRETMNDAIVPLMGVLGAFVFAAQMINFTIPGTGSSGHLTGGLLLAVLLGPYAAFLVMASIITIQALLFADGGLLALGCNIFNMAFPACFIAYPLIYRPIAGGANPSNLRLLFGSVAAAMLALQIGAFGVVLETLLSGISELPFTTFVLFMQPIHLAIGVVEGVVTAGVMGFLYRVRPELFASDCHNDRVRVSKPLLAGFAVVAFLTAGVFSWFASTHPDGLEWSIANVAGKEELEAAKDGIHGLFSTVQSKLAFMPDYSLPEEKEEGAKDAKAEVNAEAEKSKKETWPAVSPSTSLAGIIGGIITLLVVSAAGLVLKRGIAKNA
ncbi:MAG: energy-coupling factor ABC transporter permease [Dissulfuribacterales bacterium]